MCCGHCMTAILTQRVKANGLEFEVAVCGDGPRFALMMHGFPECGFSWRHQMPMLANKGYTVWAPDLRGYGGSDRPGRVRDYRMRNLVDDVTGLIDAAGAKETLLVGHDWGGAIAWIFALAGIRPLERLIVMNLPHPRLFRRGLRSWKQLRRSWYIFFFQLPWLPEALYQMQNWRLACRTLVKSSRPGTFSLDDLNAYRKAWSQPEAYTCMVNWYRAIIQRPPSPLKNPRISIPTLLIWGAKDRFLGREMAQPSIDFCDKGRLVFFEEATHWVQHEEADKVNRLLIEFLNEKSK